MVHIADTDHSPQGRWRLAKEGKLLFLQVQLHIHVAVIALALGAWALLDQVNLVEQEEQDAHQTGGDGQDGSVEQAGAQELVGMEPGTLGTGIQKLMAGAIPWAAIMPTLRGRLAAFIRGAAMTTTTKMKVPTPAIIRMMDVAVMASQAGRYPTA